MGDLFSGGFKRSVFSVGFLVLLLAFPGLARAEVEGQPCVAEPTDEIIGYSDLRTCVISPIGDSDIYRFFGAVGEIIQIRASDGSGAPSTGDVCIDLRRPNGVPFGAVTCGEALTVVDVTLDEAGEWIIIITEAGGDQTMAYNLLLERTSPLSPTNSPVESSGITLGGQMISPNIDLDFYTFQGAVGDLIQINATEGSGAPSTPDVCIDLRRPDNSRVGSVVCGELSAIIDTTLDQDGQYTIIVSEAGGDQAMNFSLLYTCFLGACPAVTQPPVCDIVLDMASYVVGDTVTANTLRLANPNPASGGDTSVEWKTWFVLPDGTTADSINLGSDGSLVLPAGFDTNFGPVPLFDVVAGAPLGSYAYNCRLLDPTTGRTIALDTNTFDIVPAPMVGANAAP